MKWNDLEATNVHITARSNPDDMDHTEGHLEKKQVNQGYTKSLRESNCFMLQCQAHAHKHVKCSAYAQRGTLTVPFNAVEFKHFHDGHDQLTHISGVYTSMSNYHIIWKSEDVTPLTVSQ